MYFRFIPKENGVHFVDVKLNDHHVPDSPFAVMVGSTAADPAMVHAHGPGLENGQCSKYITGMVSVFRVTFLRFIDLLRPVIYTYVR